MSADAPSALPTYDLKNSKRAPQSSTNKTRRGSCEDAALRSLSCQAMRPSDKTTHCAEQIAAYKSCLQAQAERRAAEKAARRAGGGAAAPATTAAASIALCLALAVALLLAPAAAADAGVPYASASASASAVASASASASASTEAARERAIKGPTFESAEVNGRSPLHFAAIEGVAAAEFLALLDKARADARAAGDTRGLVLEKQDKYGYSPLFYAATEGHADLARAMLTAGAEARARDKWLETPLHKAASRGHTGVVRVLLEAGADANAVDKNGRAPLIEAAAEDHVEIVRLLLAANANPDVVTTYGSSATSVAKSDGVKAMLQAAKERREKEHAAEQEALRARNPNPEVGAASSECAAELAAEREAEKAFKGEDIVWTTPGKNSGGVNVEVIDPSVPSPVYPEGYDAKQHERVMKAFEKERVEKGEREDEETVRNILLSADDDEDEDGSREREDEL